MVVMGGTETTGSGGAVDMKNLINKQIFIMEDQSKVEPVTPCMDVYKKKIHSDGSIDKLKLRIVVIEYLNNKELVGDTWSPTDSMRTLKYFLADLVKYESRLQQLDFIGALL